ncbi:MAG: trypsin-like peptidase domain-containing protein [Phycisphaerales bacterium]
MRRLVSFGPAFVVLLTTLVLLFGAPAVVRRIGYANTTGRIVLARQALTDDDILERLQRATRNVAETVGPSVVHVDVTSGARRRVGRSSGSGWVFDRSGHIVTNAHVLFGARNINVQFSDGRVLSAEIVGEPDPFTDIAVIKVDPFEGLFPVARATNEEPHQGDRVFVFGSPFGFKFSMSEGIISGLGREPATANDFGGYTNFIQTDAAVNPGNSGGPLVDIKGRIIGMNVAIATGRDNQGTTDGQSAGISFAIPLFTIESVVEQIIETGTVSRGMLGISWPASSRDANVSFDQTIGSGGVRVIRLAVDSPAAQAGLRERDVITRVAGKSVASVDVLRSIVSNHRPGEEVPITAWRDGAPREFTVTLAQFPRENLAQIGADNALRMFGMGVGQGLDRRPMVLGVIDESAAAEAGFGPGQVILKVGDRAVTNVEEVLVAAADQGLLLGRDVRFTVADPPREADTAAGDDAPPTPTETTRTITVRIRR